MARLHLDYFSEALGKAQSAVVIVPEKADPPFHPMLLLHGLSDDETIWTRRTSLERYVDGLPLVVVMPDGARSFYCNAHDGWPYGTAIGRELPDLMEKWLPLRQKWAIGGLSMGGYGAVLLALQNPGRYASVCSHSGALGLGHFPLDYSPDREAEMKRIYGPSPQGGPNDLFALAESASAWPAMRIDCGTEDFLIDWNRAFAGHLAGLGLEHEYLEFPGGHTWDYWDIQVQEAVAFHRRALGF